MCSFSYISYTVDVQLNSEIMQEAAFAASGFVANGMPH